MADTLQHFFANGPSRTGCGHRTATGRGRGANTWVRPQPGAALIAAAILSDRCTVGVLMGNTPTCSPPWPLQAWVDTSCVGSTPPVAARPGRDITRVTVESC